MDNLFFLFFNINQPFSLCEKLESKLLNQKFSSSTNIFDGAKSSLRNNLDAQMCIKIRHSLLLKVQRVIWNTSENHRANVPHVFDKV